MHHNLEKSRKISTAVANWFNNNLTQSLEKQLCKVFFFCGKKTREALVHVQNHVNQRLRYRATDF